MEGNFSKADIFRLNIEACKHALPHRKDEAVKKMIDSVVRFDLCCGMSMEHDLMVDYLTILAYRDLLVAGNMKRKNPFFDFVGYQFAKTLDANRLGFQNFYYDTRDTGIVYFMAMFMLAHTREELLRMRNLGVIRYAELVLAFKSLGLKQQFSHFK